MRTPRAVLPAACAAVLLGALASMSSCASLGSVDSLSLINIAAKSGEAVAKSFEDITPEQEYYVGRAVGANILAQYPPHSEAKANAYLNLLGQSLALVSDRPETFGGYHFLVLDTAEINAFAAPGGLIFVSRGLLRCADSEDGVAAILAHEIGHVVRQHGLKAIKTARFKDAGLAIGKAAVEELGSEELARVTAAFSGTIDDITSTLVNSGYSRSAEKEADLAAVDILKRAGYDPNALVAMLKIMESRLQPGGPGFAKTHPDPQDRIASIREAVGSAGTPPAAPQERAAAPPARQSRYQAALGKI
jgi:predicted Zn-dependent protease